MCDKTFTTFITHQASGRHGARWGWEIEDGSGVGLGYASEDDAALAAIEFLHPECKKTGKPWVYKISGLHIAGFPA